MYLGIDHIQTKEAKSNIWKFHEITSPLTILCIEGVKSLPWQNKCYNLPTVQSRLDRLC